MPAASSSRRKTMPKSRLSRNREPSSDGIEEDSSQRRIEEGEDEDDVDNDNDDDEPPVRSSRVKKEKLSKANRRSRRPADDENDEQVNEEHEGRIDVANFKDQPLARSAATTFTGVMSDWNTIRKQSQERGKWS